MPDIALLRRLLALTLLLVTILEPAGARSATPSATTRHWVKVSGLKTDDVWYLNCTAGASPVSALYEVIAVDGPGGAFEAEFVAAGPNSVGVDIRLSKAFAGRTIKDEPTPGPYDLSGRIAFDDATLRVGWAFWRSDASCRLLVDGVEVSASGTDGGAMYLSAADFEQGFGARAAGASGGVHLIHRADERGYLFALLSASVGLLKVRGPSGEVYEPVGNPGSSALGHPWVGVAQNTAGSWEFSVAASVTAVQGAGQLWVLVLPS